MTLEYKQSVLIETAATIEQKKNNKKIMQSTPSEMTSGKKKISIFGFCCLSLFFLLVPVSSPHLESESRRKKVGQSRVQRWDTHRST